MESWSKLWRKFCFQWAFSIYYTLQDSTKWTAAFLGMMLLSIKLQFDQLQVTVITHKHTADVVDITCYRYYDSSLVALHEKSLNNSYTYENRHFVKKKPLSWDTLKWGQPCIKDIKKCPKLCIIIYIHPWNEDTPVIRTLGFHFTTRLAYCI